MVNKQITIGILALHGAFREHKKMLEKIGIASKEIRAKKDLDAISGLILPGGESTTMSILLKKDLEEEIIRLIKNGLFVYGTCAGVILLAEKFSLIDVEVERNAYGSQLDSFEESINVKLFNKLKTFNAIFIRAPKIIKAGKGVEILAKRKIGDIVMAKQKNILVSTFHPELTNDPCIHEYFIQTLSKALKY
jgi:5'-phosphate synthase pdxT subunit